MQIFLRNLQKCEELDFNRTHPARFGSALFPYTSRHANNGHDARHRYPRGGNYSNEQTLVLENLRPNTAPSKKIYGYRPENVAYYNARFHNRRLMEKKIHITRKLNHLKKRKEFVPQYWQQIDHLNPGVKQTK